MEDNLKTKRFFKFKNDKIEINLEILKATRLNIEKEVLYLDEINKDEYRLIFSKKNGI